MATGSRIVYIYYYIFLFFFVINFQVYDKEEGFWTQIAYLRRQLSDKRFIYVSLPLCLPLIFGKSIPRGQHHGCLAAKLYHRILLPELEK